MYKIPNKVSVTGHALPKNRYRTTVCLLSLQLIVGAPAFAYANGPNHALETNSFYLQTTQEFVVKGKVTNQKGEPIEGATVRVKGSETVTSTSSAGIFSIKVRNLNDVLELTAVGYIRQEVALTNDHDIVVVLDNSTDVLDEIVVVGYGTQKKENVVGAVQQVKASDLKTTTSTLSNAFAGNIAGVIARQPRGEPAFDAATFYIRGISTFGANASPLIVLDGVEINTTMLNNIAPESIESFSILKDANGTALYGSRGANGVIIINTKTGKNTEKMLINLRADHTFSAPTMVQPIADGVTYMEKYNEAKRNDTPEGQAYVPFYSDEKIEGTRKGLNGYVFPNNDWYEMMFKDFSMNQSVNFNLTGGSKKLDYFLNASFFNETGIVKKPSEGLYNPEIDSKKYIFQSNVSTDVTKTTRLGLKMNTILWYNNRPIEDVTNLFYYAMRANPVRFPAVLPAEEGDTYVRYGNNSSWDVGNKDLNPYALLSRGSGNKHQNYLTTIFNVDQDLNGLLKGLKAKFLASFYNYAAMSLYKSFTPFYYKVDDDYTSDGQGGYQFTTSSIGDPGNTYLTYTTDRDGRREYSVQGTITYDNKIGDHTLGAMLVYNAHDKTINIAATENDVLPYRQQGVAGRFSYNYASKYIGEFNFGYNGSENFIQGKRFGFFPSAALGYIVSNESFFEPLKAHINLLKLRASYGISGNDALSSRFPYLTIVSMNGASGLYKGMNFAGTSGPSISVLGNEDATWEVAKKYNFGLDLGINREIDFTIDYFREDRSGIFMQRQSLPTSVGLAGSTPYGNIGKVKNMGVDFSLSYKKMLNDNLSMSFTGNFTYAHNEVVDKDEPQLLYTYTSAIGHPINTNFGLLSDRLFANQQQINESAIQEYSTYKPGDIKYQDLNADGKINKNDVTAIGMPTVPEIVYGLNGMVNYKKMDFSFLLQGQSRVSLMMSNMHPFASTGQFGFGITQYIADDHWSEENQNIDAKYPRLTSTWNENNVQASDYWLRDASFLRLKYMEIGYRFKKVVRIYAAGSNLFSIHSFKHWDPEMGGGNGLFYPLQRTAKLGIQCQF
ncbi:SusC/RagA family TonB-linked outer membrane protein [Sphingobacterium humi]|uniref:SusC/RagA family TonB-linked outer membrane protein n=1 Tax=Sphingobacterium humi TaxID=1796905 RepID=A0A6N8KTA7_9SPHI|nr:TonB-dependent receptor [Sphingobacterium humi]MVZ60645.1 SusC/RagA family TonB-linked outer membrane protein [Sphingobacterium humi]